jgi:hypothetical protein
MRTEISFCPLCAGKLDAGEDEQFVCEDCESEFFIQLVEEGDDDDDEDEDEEEENETDEDDEEEEIDDDDDE